MNILHNRSTLLIAGVLVLAASAFFAAHANASVVTYPMPSGGIPRSNDFSVSVDGNNVDVYSVGVSPNAFPACTGSEDHASMAYFDFSGSVNVQITSSVAISSAVVRPLRLGINPSISGNTVSFPLSQPANLSVEINGDEIHNLNLFANPIESGSTNATYYFGPGVHGDGSRIYLNPGESVYIAGGAVVYGVIRSSGVGNYSVRGRGILSGEKNLNLICGYGDPATTSFVDLQGGGAINLEGIIGLDPSSWAYIVAGDSINVDNIKLIGFRHNSDAIDIIHTNSATIKNVFLRTQDDHIAIKNDPYFMDQTGKPTQNVWVEDSVLWPASHAISFMEQSGSINNINFKNIDIIHSYRGDIIWAEGGTNIDGVTMDDIRIENVGPNVSNIFALNSGFNNAYINNVQVLGGSSAPSTINTVYPNYYSANITFNNLNYFGNYILSASQGQFTIGSNANIDFTQGGATPPTPSTPSCHILDSSQAVPTGFGASYNVLSSAQELLLKAN
ncbi:hypothetical protein HYT01_01130, partial [Candidatus Giovannonibacteria bacterium]|nr:hypothetical protein [Candidatus Giovannonibacteria bacterium]